MKFLSDRAFALTFRQTLRVAVMVPVVFCLGSIDLRAQLNPHENIATLQAGTAVIYSSPLLHGASANGFVQPNSNPLAFANKKANAFMMVLDLGKSFDLNTASIKFSSPCQLNIYVLKAKPAGGATWISSIQNIDPAATVKSSGGNVYLNGASGEFIVLIFHGYPGYFYGFYLTGLPTPYIVPHRNPYLDRPLEQVPPPYHAFPGVPPASD